MPMKVAEKQKSVGQSVWIAHLSRPAVGDESLRHFISDWSITGMSLSPLAICRAMSDTDAYDYAVAKKLAEGLYGPPLFNRLILEDGQRAADLLRPVHDSSEGLDGWAVMPVSPLFIDEDRSLVANYKQIWDQAERPNLMLGLPAFSDQLCKVEELVGAGIPINIANVYSAEQFRAAARACLAGVTRRFEAGHRCIGSPVISIEIDALITALRHKVTHRRARILAVATARFIYRVLRELHHSPEWSGMIKAGVQPLRLVWACAGEFENTEIDNDLCACLIAPYTSVSLPQELIPGYAARNVDDDLLPTDGVDWDQILAESALKGVDVESEAQRLQLGCLDRLLKQWALLVEHVARKSADVVHLKASAFCG